MSYMKTARRKTCRLCDSPQLTELFSLGNLAISTFVNKPQKRNRNAPLELIWCENCTLVQLRHTAPQELMYSGVYWYKSGVNEKIVNDLKDIVNQGLSLVNKSDGGTWLDIGANDGTLLSFVPSNWLTLGVEPAKNLQEELAKNCIAHTVNFWENVDTLPLADKNGADVITAIGMFYDSENPNLFVSNVTKHLATDGVFIAQLMTLKPMLEKNDIGNICHEHLEYYSYSSLKYLFESNGLEIFKVEENDINGGSYRLYARHFRNGSIDYPENITKEDVMDFYKRLAENRDACVSFINTANKEGKKIYGYGASTKLNTVLQWYGLPNKDLIAIGDRNPAKWGKYTVSTHVPVINESEAREEADFFFIGPWGFTKEFEEREKEFFVKGGKFITHTPNVRIYSK